MKPLRVEHIAIAVKDIDEAMKLYQDVFGLELEDVEVFEEYLAKLALLRLGDCLIELIQGTTPESEYAKFVEERGEGLHHICFEVEDIEKTLKEAERKGVPLIDRTSKRGHQSSKIAFLNPAGANGVLLELCEKAR